MYSLQYSDLHLEDDLSMLFNVDGVTSDSLHHSSIEPRAFTQYAHVDTTSEHELDRSPLTAVTPEISQEQMELPCLFDDVVDFSQLSARNDEIELQFPIKEEHSYSNEVLCLGELQPSDMSQVACSALSTAYPLSISPQIKLEANSSPIHQSSNLHLGLVAGHQIPGLISPTCSSGSSSDSDTYHPTNSSGGGRRDSLKHRPSLTYRGIPVNSPNSQIIYNPCTEAPAHSQRSIYYPLPYSRPSGGGGSLCRNENSVVGPTAPPASLNDNSMTGFTHEAYYTSGHGPSSMNGHGDYQGSEVSCRRNAHDEMLSLPLSEEEKRTFVMEGYPLPAGDLPLSKMDEKNLKKVRRKLKNKWSAQESRRKPGPTGGPSRGALAAARPSLSESLSGP
jgi:hypothetical protein